MRYCSAEEAVRHINDGEYLHWPCVAGAPEVLIESLVGRADRGELHHVNIRHLYTEGYADYVLPQYREVFHLESFFVGGNVRKATQSGLAGHIPCSVSESARMVRSGACPCDVVMLMVSEPDAEGRVSLGISVDYMPTAIERARLAIVQVNRYMPFTYGDAVVKTHGENIIASNGREVPALFVHHDVPLREASPLLLSETDIAIGRHVAELIPDGATMQIGIGNMPTAVLAQLSDHKDLGVVYGHGDGRQCDDRRDVPFNDPCLLQEYAVPGRRQCHPRHA